MISDQPNQKQILATFWQRLDQQYFDLNNHSIKLLHNLLVSSPNKPQTAQPVYANYEQYRTIQDMLNAYFKTNSRKKVHTLNKQNIKKYLYLYESLNDRENMQELVLKLSSARQIIKETSGLSMKLQIRRLKDEEIELNQILMERECERNDLGEIEQMIQQLEQDRQQHSTINLPRLQQLQASVDVEPKVEEQMTLKLEKKQFYLRKRKPLSERQQSEVSTIKQLIVKLQDKQTAESISKVQLDYKSIKVQQISPSLANQAVTWYDPHLTDQVQIIDLDQLSDLQRLRDVPLLVKDLSTRSRSETLNENQIYFCHYCKQNLELSLVMQCTYSSETMGLPEYDQELTLSSKVQIDESKKNKFIHDFNLSNYQIKNGHLICRRYFCQNCLKYECDVKPEDFQKKNWLCPLCQVYQYKHKLLRDYAHVHKLKRMYTESGGEIQDLDDQSYFEQLVSYKKNGGTHIMDKNGSKKETKEKKASSKLGGQKNLQSHNWDSTANTKRVVDREIFMDDEQIKQIQDNPMKGQQVIDTPMQ